MRTTLLKMTTALILSGACSGSQSINPNTPAVASVTISPPSISLQVGMTLQLSGSARDSAGNGIANRRASWSSADTTVASVSATGMLSARKAGSTSISLTIDGKTASAPATIALVPAASVSVAPTTPTAQVGGTVQFSATVRDAAGNALSGRSISWSSSKASVATVTSGGLASAAAAGTANIIAVCEGVSGQATLTVTTTAPPPPAPVATVSVTLAASSLTAGQTTQATAVTKDANGAVLTGRSISWTSSSTSVATVSTSGLVTAVAQGTASITATSEGKSGSASLTVTASSPPPPPTTVDTIFAETFESGGLAAWDDGVDPTRQHVITDPTLSHGGSHALEVDYPANDTGGWLTRFFMPGYDSVYVRMWVRLAPDWVGGSKLLLLRGSRTDNQWSAFGVAGQCPTGTDFFATNIMMEGNGDPGTLRFYTYYPEMSREPDGVTCWGRYGDGNEQYLPLMSLTRGVWQQLEFWVRLNTPGQHDGIQKFWVNGVLRGVWNNLSYRTSTILKLNSVSIELSSPIASVPRKLWIDDILVLTAPPTP